MSSLSNYLYQKDKRAKPENLLTKRCFLPPQEMLLTSLTNFYVHLPFSYNCVTN
jgi:hypothetical protein